MKNISSYFKNAAICLSLFSLPFVVSAAVSADVQARLDALFKEISQLKIDIATLQTKEAALKPTGTPVPTPLPACRLFLRDIQFGNTGSEVQFLASVLTREGFLHADPLAVPGQVAVFDERIAAAVVAFQLKYTINATGYVGPITRARLNSLVCSSAPNPSAWGTTPSPSPSYGYGTTGYGDTFQSSYYGDDTSPNGTFENENSDANTTYLTIARSADSPGTRQTISSQRTDMLKALVSVRGPAASVKSFLLHVDYYGSSVPDLTNVKVFNGQQLISKEGSAVYANYFYGGYDITVDADKPFPINNRYPGAWTFTTDGPVNGIGTYIVTLRGVVAVTDNGTPVSLGAISGSAVGSAISFTPKTYTSGTSPR